MAEGLTIDELARAASTTSRNIRAYQSRGLLPPPKISGRTGLYDDGHSARIQLILRLQERGFALKAIKDLLEAWEEGASLGDILGFNQALEAPWTEEASETFTTEQLGRIFPEILEDAALLTRAVELGLLEHVEGRFIAPSPRLIALGAELVAAGVPLAAVLDDAAELRSDAGRVAERFVQMFQNHVWMPFLSGQHSAKTLSELTGVLQRLRPLATESVEIFLGQAMEAAIAAATERDLQDQIAMTLSGQDISDAG